MDDSGSRTDIPVLQWKALRAGATVAGSTERLVREAWRQYYVARLAEAQFGPDSLEASIAHSNAMTSYRQLRGTLREMDPYYQDAPKPGAHSQSHAGRHLRLVRDDLPEPASTVEP